VKREFTWLLLGALSVFFSCNSSQIKPSAYSNNYSIDVTIVNNTHFDLEILDETRTIPRFAEKAVTLPAFLGELNNGYPVIYRVPLMDDIFVKLNRIENIIIKNDQRIAFIETPDFHSSLCFLILKNYGKQTISLKSGNDYLSSLLGVNPNAYNSSPYLSPGNTYLYELKPGKNDLLIETDQYRSIVFPFNIAEAGYVYAFIFDGNEAIPTDARPLVDIGKSAPLAVEFAGGYVSELERQQLTTVLTAGLELSELPFRPLSAGEFSLLAERVFHALKITLNTQVIPAQPPINRELIRAELQLSLMRNGKVLAVSETKSFTEMSREVALNVSSNFLSDLSWCQALFSEVYK
jgi:hypothetical protein